MLLIYIVIIIVYYKYIVIIIPHYSTVIFSEQLAAFAALRKNYKTIDLTRSFGTAERLVEAKINCANLLEKVSC